MNNPPMNGYFPRMNGEKNELKTERLKLKGKERFARDYITNLGNLGSLEIPP